MHRHKVKCRHHGERAGYVVCRCVVDQGATVARVVTPEASDFRGIGSITCARSEENHQLDELVLICDACVAARGWLTPIATTTEPTQ